MKIIYIILIVVILSFLGSCKKEPYKNAINSMNVDIAYKDNSENDLLDPATPNYFSPDNIHVYNVVNGVKKEVYHPNYDFPNNFIIYRNDDLSSYYLRLFIEADTILLQLNTAVVDTVTSVSEESNGNWHLKKVWYNGVLEWDDIAVPQEFTIVE